MMRQALIILTLLGLVPLPAKAAPATIPPTSKEELQAELSTREISIQSNFTGIEILIYGSIDFSQTEAPDTGTYDVITVIRSPSQPLVVRRKERVFGIWVNTPGHVFPAVPGFYAALSTRPFRAIASDQTLKELGIGIANLDFGQPPNDEVKEAQFRSAMIRLKKQQRLFQELDDGVAFVGRSLFRATVALPVNVPIGRYTADVYLFRDGELISKSLSTLEVSKAGFERTIYVLAFAHPLLYGLLAVLVAVLTGLAGWFAFRRE
ncbi:MAG TPA: TIGR02186 family protein [Methyloceanibacter sp.]|nr:TIGR02186 family protein [Methyloceanibacter sp.]